MKTHARKRLPADRLPTYTRFDTNVKRVVKKGIHTLSGYRRKQWRDVQGRIVSSSQLIAR